MIISNAQERVKTIKFLCFIFPPFHSNRGNKIEQWRDCLLYTSIEEAALAIRLEATLDEFTDTIHCHPTVAEALREAALAAQKRAIHIPNKK